MLDTYVPKLMKKLHESYSVRDEINITNGCNRNKMQDKKLDPQKSYKKV